MPVYAKSNASPRLSCPLPALSQASVQAATQLEGELRKLPAQPGNFGFSTSAEIIWKSSENHVEITWKSLQCPTLCQASRLLITAIHIIQKDSKRVLPGAWSPRSHHKLCIRISYGTCSQELVRKIQQGQTTEINHGLVLTPPNSCRLYGPYGPYKHSRIFSGDFSWTLALSVTEILALSSAVRLPPFG